MAKAQAVKPSFGSGVLSGLRQAAGTPKSGEPLTLLLDHIEEDPNQPRHVFSDAELEQMAETIRLVGVLSPVGVRKRDGDRYVLVYGARRLRGSRLAGKTRIPAVLVPDEQATLAVQVIENQARAGLANSDLAAVVNRLFVDKMTVKQIGVVCNLKEYQVAAFRSADKLPPFLRSRLDEADMRALYDLFRTWEKHPAEVEAAVPPEGTHITITEARRIIEGVTGKASGSVTQRRKEDQAAEIPVVESFEDEQPAVSLPADEGPATPAVTPMLPAPQPAEDLHGASPRQAPEASREGVRKAHDELKRSPEALTSPAHSTRPAGSPVFVMELSDGRRGVLVTNRRSGTKGLALLDVQGESVEAPFVELRPVDVD